MSLSPIIREYDKLTEDQYAKQDSEDKKHGRRNKWIALALCLFLGWFGVHKYYELKFGTGLVYILLTLMDPLMTFVAISLDALFILTKPRHYYIERYEFEDVRNSYNPED